MNIRRLLSAMLLGGIAGAIPKQVLRIIETPTEWALVETWEANNEDERWVFRDNNLFNGFSNLCRVLNFNKDRIRNFIQTPPQGYHKEPIVIATGSFKDMKEIKSHKQIISNRKIPCFPSPSR